MSTVDFERFENELVARGSASFRRIRELRPNDTFYCFAFFTSPEFGYISTTASTYEGLEEVARWYQRQEMHKHKGLDELEKELKWSPGDSPLKEQMGGIIEPLQAYMDQIKSELYDSYVGDDDWAEFNEYVERVETSIASALRRIDGEGVFGSGDERSGIVVNLLMGDQSDEARIRFAKRVNPPEAIEMLITDLDA